MYWRQHSTERRERIRRIAAGTSGEETATPTVTPETPTADSHTGNSYRFYTHDDTDNEDQPSSDNEYDRAYQEYWPTLFI